MDKETRSYHLVDPEFRNVIEQVPAIPLTKDILPDARDQLNQMLAQMFNDDSSEDSEVTKTELYIDTPESDHQIRLLVFQPKHAKDDHPIYLDIHGGGRILGLPEMDDQQNREMVREFGVTVVSVDYRLSPETPHPGPLEDCYTALKWVHDHAHEYQASPNKIAIGGTSAGGGLAASLAILARDRGEVDIKFQDLQVPMLNDQTPADTEQNPFLGEFVWNSEQDYFGWDCYLGNKKPGDENITPYESASRLKDFTNLPPALISIGSIELFANDSIDYAKNLLNAGVPTELHVYPGLYHGAHLLVPEAAVSKQMHHDHYEALRRAFSRM